MLRDDFLFRKTNWLKNLDMLMNDRSFSDETKF
jgi:hypothetical protein